MDRPELQNKFDKIGINSSFVVFALFDNLYIIHYMLICTKYIEIYIFN